MSGIENCDKSNNEFENKCVLHVWTPWIDPWDLREIHLIHTNDITRLRTRYVDVAAEGMNTDGPRFSWTFLHKDFYV